MKPSCGQQLSGESSGLLVAGVAQHRRPTGLARERQVDLPTPSERTLAGYRQHAAGDLDRLSQLLFYRELSFPVEEMSTLPDDPGADQSEHRPSRRCARVHADNAHHARLVAYFCVSVDNGYDRA